VSRRRDGSAGGPRRRSPGRVERGTAPVTVPKTAPAQDRPRPRPPLPGAGRAVPGASFPLPPSPTRRPKMGPSVRLGLQTGAERGTVGSTENTQTVTEAETPRVRADAPARPDGAHPVPSAVQPVGWMSPAVRPPAVCPSAVCPSAVHPGACWRCRVPRRNGGERRIRDRVRGSAGAAPAPGPSRAPHRSECPSV
jgi:hypothetical protein